MLLLMNNEHELTRKFLFFHYFHVDILNLSVPSSLYRTSLILFLLEKMQFTYRKSVDNFSSYIYTQNLQSTMKYQQKQQRKIRKSFQFF